MEYTWKCYNISIVDLSLFLVRGVTKNDELDHKFYVGRYRMQRGVRLIMDQEMC